MSTDLKGAEATIFNLIKKAGQSGLSMRGLRSAEGAFATQVVSSLVQKGLVSRSGDTLRAVENSMDSRKDESDKAPVRQLRRVGTGRGPIKVGEKVRWGQIGGTWEVKSITTGPQGGTATVERLDGLQAPQDIAPGLFYRADARETSLQTAERLEQQKQYTSAAKMYRKAASEFQRAGMTAEAREANKKADLMDQKASGRA